MLANRTKSNGFTHYAYANGRGDGRRYAGPESAQRLRGRIRALLPHLADIDLEASHPSILIDLCRAKGIAVPSILRRIVIDKDAIRKELSEHYFGSDSKHGRDFGKQIINAFLYGRLLTNTQCLVDAGVDPSVAHSPIVQMFSEAMELLVPQLVSQSDRDAAEDRFLRENKPLREYKLLCSGLSDLCCRVEAQKLACALDRLESEWGFDVQLAVIMHDGAMVPTALPLPTHRAAREGRSTIDKTILDDITRHVRRELNTSKSKRVQTQQTLPVTFLGHLTTQMTLQSNQTETKEFCA